MKIHESYKYVAYSDGERTIELDIERGDKDAILYVPRDEKWNEKYPWGKGRRNEIVQIILERLNQNRGKYEYLIKDFF